MVQSFGRPYAFPVPPSPEPPSPPIWIFQNLHILFPMIFTNRSTYEGGNCPWRPFTLTSRWNNHMYILFPISAYLHILIKLLFHQKQFPHFYNDLLTQTLYLVLITNSCLATMKWPTDELVSVCLGLLQTVVALRIHKAWPLKRDKIIANKPWSNTHSWALHTSFTTARTNTSIWCKFHPSTLTYIPALLHRVVSVASLTEERRDAGGIEWRAIGRFRLDAQHVKFHCPPVDWPQDFQLAALKRTKRKKKS